MVRLILGNPPRSQAVLRGEGLCLGLGLGRFM